jgi:hypothetical protein
VRQVADAMTAGRKATAGATLAVTEAISADLVPVRAECVAEQGVRIVISKSELQTEWANRLHAVIGPLPLTVKWVMDDGSRA